MKYLAIDYGQARTGIAVSDAGGAMAFPRTTILMRGKDAFFIDLIKIIEEENAEAVVVGLPVRTDGTDSETTRQARNMAARLKRRITLPVYFMEETLSSFEAEDRLREAGRSGKNLKASLDQAAAAGILESFLALPLEKRILA